MADKIRGDRYLKGAIDGGKGPFREQRIEGFVKQLHNAPDRLTKPGAYLAQASRADVYGGGRGGRVSIEGAARREHTIKSRLDQQVTDENIHDDAVHVKGLPPCKRVRRQG